MIDDAIAPRYGRIPQFAPGGRAGRPDTKFNVDTTCVVEGPKDWQGNPLPGSSVQCFGVVRNTPQDKAAAKAYGDLLESERTTIWEDLASVTIDPIKNLAAGAINSVIPGSNLGDSNNFFRDVGELGGSIAQLVVPGLAPAKLLATATKSIESVSVLSSIIGAVNKAVGSPVGQIAASFLPSLVPGIASQVTSYSNAPQAAALTQQLPNVTTQKISPASAAALYGTASIPGVTVSTGVGSQEMMPAWLKYTLIGVGILFLLLFGWILIFKRK